MEEKLVDFLQKIRTDIGHGKIRLESDLAKRTYEKEKRNTLFYLLGYRDNDVKSQPRQEHVDGQLWFAPDYLLMRQEKPLIVFDIKSPAIDLDGVRSVLQICSYMRMTHAPLGVLFNGRDLRVFANTELPGIRSLKSFSCPSITYKGFPSTKAIKKPISFIREPIAVADDTVSHVALLLTNLSKLSLEQSAPVIARSMARNRAKEIAKGAAIHLRHQAIRKQLDRIRENPSRDVLHAILKASNPLDSLTPSMDELKQNWLPIQNPKTLAERAWEKHQSHFAIKKS